MGTADRSNRIVWVTASGTELDHAVVPRNARFGVGGSHLSVCGAKFRPAPLVADPGRRCVACIRYLATSGIPAVPEHRRNDGGDGLVTRRRNAFRCSAPVVLSHSPGASPARRPVIACGRTPAVRPARSAWSPAARSTTLRLLGRRGRRSEVTSGRCVRWPAHRPDSHRIRGARASERIESEE